MVLRLFLNIDFLVSGIAIMSRSLTRLIQEFTISNPYPDLSVKSLQFHTLDQAVEDLAYFAQNVKLAMPGGDSVSPNTTAWVLTGGSYAGSFVFHCPISTSDVGSRCADSMDNGQVTNRNFSSLCKTY